MMFALLLMAMVGVQAQSLLGTWKTTMADDDGEDMECYITFSAGQKMTMKLIQNMSDDDMGVFELTVTIPGTYTMKDKTISLNMNTQRTDVKFTKMKFNSETEQMFKEMPQLKKLFVEELDKAMEKSKDELKGDLPLDGDMTVISLTNTTLKVESGKDVMTFTKTR